MKKIRIGVLGATRGMDYAAGAFRGHPYAEVRAVCETHTGLISRARVEAEKLGLKITWHSDFDDLLSDDIDAVIVSNHANEHAPCAVRALDSGRHVLSELMPAQNMAEAVELCEAVERSGKIYRYAENYCYHPEKFEMRLRYDRGDIGELVSAECDFINDCSFKWHLLTRGDRNHWRNFVPSTFYCTHSIGPMLFISGLRPRLVVGMEPPPLPYMRKHGARNGGAAMEVMLLENGALCKSLNGNLRRPFLSRCRMIGTEGCMEGDIFEPGKLHVFTGGEKEGSFITESYLPENCSRGGLAEGLNRGGRSGISYVAEFFAGSILGDETALRYSIDVYRAMDMSLPGLLAYRSILSGCVPCEIPDFRDKAQREKYRNDRACTDPKAASGDELLPSCGSLSGPVPDEVYAAEAARFAESLEKSFRLGSN